MQETEFAVRVLVLLLLVASAVAMATKWIRIPYTLALVIIGLVISPMNFLPAVHVSPDVILLIFLPALLFEAAWNLNLEDLRKNLGPILTLAVLGVCVSLAVVGIVLHYLGGLSWSSSLLFGAMISATDPVSVLALFRKFGLPHRLSIVIEGESLLNDGTAAVLFRIIVGIVAAGVTPSVGVLLSTSIREFGVVVFGGVAVGAVVGAVASKVTSYFDDRRLEITLTTIAAYGSYLLSDSLHVSGVIGVLIAGLVLGNYGRSTGMSASTQIAVNAFWDYMAFVANSLAFLLIGLDVHLSDFFDVSNGVWWGIAAMLLGRVAAVYPLLALMNLFTEPLPMRWGHVLVWGGLRGSLSIALVLSLSIGTPGRSELVTMVFGAVIFSLLIQGLTLGPLLAKLKFSARKTGVFDQSEKVRAQMVCAAAASQRLDSLRKEGRMPTGQYETLRSRFEEAYDAYGSLLLELRASDPMLEEQEQVWLLQTIVEAKKIRLSALRSDGSITEELFIALQSEFDEEARGPGGQH